MKKWIAIVALFFIGFVAKAQYGNTYNGPDRYFYDEEFDWRWDIRVRISDGYNSGFLTRRESNRLYRNLEDIERKEWAFQSDGHYSVWEQDEIWLDVVDLNRRIGLELTDWDRRYYGYSGVVISGRLPWYFGSTYDFNRFDRRGYGTIQMGYSPRNYYPVKHIYYTHNNNYTSHWSNARVGSSSRTATTSRVTEPRRVESGRTSNMRNTESSRVSTPRSTETGRVRTSTSEPSRSSSDIQRESSRVSSGSSMNSSRPESGSREAGNVSRSNSSNTTRESSRVSTPAPTRSSGSSSVDRSSSRTSSSVDRSSSSRTAKTESNTSSSRSASTSNGRGRN